MNWIECYMSAVGFRVYCISFIQIFVYCTQIWWISITDSLKIWFQHLKAFSLLWLASMVLFRSLFHFVPHLWMAVVSKISSKMKNKLKIYRKGYQYLTLIKIILHTHVVCYFTFHSIEIVEFLLFCFACNESMLKT